MKYFKSSLKDCLRLHVKIRKKVPKPDQLGLHPQYIVYIIFEPDFLYLHQGSNFHSHIFFSAVSLQVEPIQPPAYDALPPPYYTLEPGSSNKKEELTNPEYGPPPAYTP